MREPISTFVVDVDMLGDASPDYHHQDDHRLQTDHVVLQHRPRPLGYLDGLGVSESQDEVDADVGEDEDEEGDEGGHVDKDTLEFWAMLCPLHSSEEGDQVVVHQVGKLADKNKDENTNSSVYNVFKVLQVLALCSTYNLV